MELIRKTALFFRPMPSREGLWPLNLKFTYLILR